MRVESGFSVKEPGAGRADPMRNVALVRRTAGLAEMVVHGSVFFVPNACYVSHLIARSDFGLLHMPRFEPDL
jgi:hypothetical protein